jgi:copper transport protein
MIMAKGNLFRFVLGALCSVALMIAAGMQVSAKEDDNFFTHIHTDKAMANVTVSPGRAGPVDITIQLETMDETPLKVKAVSVTLSSTKAGVKAQTIPATKTGDSEWHVKTSLPVQGRWMLGLGILISDTDKVDVEAPILVK